jgi:hypothetical protein
LIFGKGFVFENSLVPFCPYIPHKDTSKDFPSSINEEIIKGVISQNFYSGYNIISLQVCSLKVGGSLVPEMHREITFTQEMILGLFSLIAETTPQWPSELFFKEPIPSYDSSISYKP